MSKKFNLWLLHKLIDIHPRSWICVNGDRVNEFVYDLERTILNEKNITREKLSHIIANKLGCHFAIIKRLLQGKTEFYPIPVLLELCKLTKNGNKILSKIHSNIKYLKVNSASSKPLKSTKKLTIDLCKIIGAFMADGSLSFQLTIESKNESDLKLIENKLKILKYKFSKSYSKKRAKFFLSTNVNYENFDKLEYFIIKFSKKANIQTHYNIELMDEHKTSVEAFNNWIKKIFYILPTSFNKRGNAWRTIFSNKIVARFLITYFGIKSGYKTDIAFEPKIIRNSNIRFRCAFALGVLTFDGSSTIAGNISFDTKSKNLFDSISDILTKINIKFGVKSAKEIYGIFTYKNNDLRKLNNLFEKSTIKWLRFKESYKKTKGDEFELRYKKFAQSKITFDELTRILKQIKSCDIVFLTKYFNCAHTSVIHYLKILKNNNKIKLSSQPINFNPQFVSPKTMIYLNDDFHNEIFNKIKKEFGEYQKFGKYMNIHKATLSNWKLKKSRIPLPIIKKICNILNIDHSLISYNIEEVDRRIVEVI